MTQEATQRKEAMKPTTKKERNAVKARARSQRNTAERNRTTAQQRRTARRHPERLSPSVPTYTEAELQAMTVPELRLLLVQRDVKTTSKMRKAELIEKVLN